MPSRCFRRCRSSRVRGSVRAYPVQSTPNVCISLRRPRTALASSCATPAPAAVKEPEGDLPGRMTLVARSTEPGHRNAVVLHHAATVLLPLAELSLRLGVPRLGQLA